MVLSRSSANYGNGRERVKRVFPVESDENIDKKTCLVSSHRRFFSGTNKRRIQMPC